MYVHHLQGLEAIIIPVYILIFSKLLETLMKGMRLHTDWMIIPSVLLTN